MILKQFVVAAVLVAGSSFVFAAQAGKATEARQAAAQRRDAAKQGEAARLGTALKLVENTAPAARSQRPQAAGPQAADNLRRKLPVLRVRDGLVAISAYGDNLPALQAQLVAHGLQDATIHDTAITGRAPVAALRELAAVSGLRFLRPSMAMTRRDARHDPGHKPKDKPASKPPVKPTAVDTGVVSQGVRSLRVDRARRETGVIGKGVRVGVLSDSFDCAPGPFEPGARFTRAADDVRNNDLPRDIRVLKDLSPVPSDDCSDEGRAMMQIVHDVAPGASQSFYTAFESQEDFAAGIRALARDGADVIVDDIIYFAEPMFEDGIIAQAVDQVHRQGVAYFSSAGNDARQSYESSFRLSSEEGISGLRHDFARGAAVDGLQRATASAGSVTLLSFQWDQPSLSANGKRGAQSDVDVWFYDETGEPFEFCSDDPEQLVCQIPGIDVNVDGDAIELPIMVNLSDEDLVVQVGVELYEGPTPNYIKYVWFDLDVGTFQPLEYSTASGTVYGHANAAGAEAVGAAAWYQTAEWGSPLRPQCVPACLNSFSSAGGTPIFLGKNGRRLPFPQVRVKPGVTGPDGGNTSFFLFDLDFEIPGTSEPDGFPNFFGTSAAAPHVAAVAALMLEVRPRLSPDLIYWGLRLTAADMKLRNLGGDIGPQRVDNANGFDFDTGFGFVDAQRALRVLRGF